ncbi:MAG: hypothetical protein HYS13_08640 [Planctomycetia bacterium]|nr:hypothetical protein [Planctomycetia bacterium]
MTPPVSRDELLAQIDSRHDELIEGLDELNQRLETVLAKLKPPQPMAAPSDGRQSG